MPAMPGEYMARRNPETQHSPIALLEASTQCRVALKYSGLCRRIVRLRGGCFLMQALNRPGEP